MIMAKRWFNKPGFRHFLQTVVSVALSIGLAHYIPAPAAAEIGTAAGAIVGGA